MLLSLLLTAGTGARQIPSATPAESAVHFTYVDLYVDSGQHPLGAYQLELTATAGQVVFVGVEGGEHAAFNSAPYYDPQAMTLNRLILAAYSVSPELPHGKTRVARVHVQVTGGIKPQYTTRLTVAADAEGQPISTATLWLTPAPLEGVAP